MRFLGLSALLLALSVFPSGAEEGRICIDSGWSFALGHASDAGKDFGFGYSRLFAKTAENYGTPIRPEFDDSAWERVDVPHDWVVGLRPENRKGAGTKGHGYKPVGGAYPENSIGWYRKKFETPSGSDRIRLVFDGVSREADIWINSFWLGKHKSGYIGVGYDITDFLNGPGEENVLVLRVDATREEGWWYEGAGIYRHVWLEPFSRVDFTRHGVFVSSRLSDDMKEAEVTFDMEMASWEQEDFEGALIARVKTPSGELLPETRISVTVPAEREARATLKMTVHNPELWDLDSPSRYYAECLVEDASGKVRCRRALRFGIRSIAFSASEGFSLNGRKMKIQGVCCHQDHAGVGIAVPDFLQYYRISLLKGMGANAYRCSHNPPAPELLEACDSLGMLVLDETRLTNSSPEYMWQFEEMVLRDRNHPSIFMWSIGNEEERFQSRVQGERIARSFLRKLHSLDHTRPATYAANNGGTWEGINSVIDIRGFNYGHRDIVSYHGRHPSQPVMGSEMASTVSTRGAVAVDSLLCYLPDQDINYPSWGSTAETWWKIAHENEWFMGGFVWTGFDYKGEPTPFGWPNINSHFGIMDICGFPKNVYYYYKSWWTDSDFIHISPHWNNPVPKGQPVKVYINSNADEVTLYLNGKKIGTGQMPRAGHLEWTVDYAPGTLKAVARKGGRRFSSSVSTTGEPVSILLEPSRRTVVANGMDGIVVNVSLLDKKGRFVPDAVLDLDFHAEGAIRIIGVGNGDPSSHEPDKSDGGSWHRKLFGGRCQVLLQSSGEQGKGVLTVSGKGLPETKLKTECR